MFRFKLWQLFMRLDATSRAMPSRKAGDARISWNVQDISDEALPSATGMGYSDVPGRDGYEFRAVSAGPSDTYNYWQVATTVLQRSHAPCPPSQHAQPLVGRWACHPEST